MDLRQLNALLAVADHGSFSAAARALHTVQSNISTHVAHLEKELGITVVDRAAGALTDEGQVVVQRARRVRAELDALAADAASMHDQVSGPARLGIIGTTGRWLTPLVFDEAQERHPKIRLTVVDATTNSLLPQLTRANLDLAVVTLPTEDPDVDEELLFIEEQMVVAPSDHPIAECEVVTLPELAKYPMIIPSDGTALRLELDAAAAAAGVKLQAKAEIDGLRLAASLAFQGFSPAVLPASAAPGWLDSGDLWKRIPLDGLAGRGVGLITTRRGLPSSPARAIAQIVRDVIVAHAPNQPGIQLA